MTLRGSVIAACIMAPLVANAQDRERCELVPTPVTRFTRAATPGGQGNTFIGGGSNAVHVRCPGKDLVLRSDSLESYGDEGRLFLLGNVRYNEPRLALTSDYLTYFQRDERAVAQGNVNAKLPDGSTLRGPVAEYLRIIPGMRPATRLTANGRPTITLVQKDSAGVKPPPTTVVANNVLMIGDSLVYAGGQVLVTREDVIARGDSMDLDSEREITVMMRNPSIEGRRERPFRLSGTRIELTGSERKLSRVLAKGSAKAVSEDMTLASDTIDLRVAADLLQRAIAWGPSRADMASAAQHILADSIDVSMPNQRVREMHAVRKAVAEGKPDTTRFRADTVDWMRGDTIVARFDTSAVAPNDSARAARLRELVAQGNAKSYYHLPPADSTVRRPAINYVSGREIIVAFEDQRVAKVTVLERAAGVYLEPKPEAAKADTTRTQAPATSAPPRPGAPPRRPPR